METWKAVVGYDGFYEVSDLGRVRRIKPGQGARCRVLKACKGTPGYVSVALCRDGKAKFFRIHQLVMGAFVGPPPKGYEINHKDGNKENPRLDNLEWMTRSENAKHAFTNLGHKPTIEYGETRYNAKLTNETVAYIRSHTPAYGVGTRLANELGVSLSTVCKVLHGQSWQHLLPP